ncbi:unnamed protein product, partial [Gulo gulo]
MKHLASLVCAKWGAGCLSREFLQVIHSFNKHFLCVDGSDSQRRTRCFSLPSTFAPSRFP